MTPNPNQVRTDDLTPTLTPTPTLTLTLTLTLTPTLTLTLTRYAQMTGQTREKLIADLDRDNYMSAQQALDYGLIDRIIASPS